MSAAGSEALVSALEILGVLVVSGVGTWWVIRRERRHPTSYTRQPSVLEHWAAKSAHEQMKDDDAALDAGEKAETGTARRRSEWPRYEWPGRQPEVVADASEAAEIAAARMAEAAKRNALFHP